MNLKLIPAIFVGCLTLAGGLKASDHDDGEMDGKGRSLNLTDLYAFREDNQTGNSADSENLILVMNSNPRSLPGQQYFFSSNARYEFHLSRVLDSDKDKRPTGQSDIILRVTFGAPDVNSRQTINLAVIRDGIEQATSGNLQTSNIGDSKAGSFDAQLAQIDGQSIGVAAGLREDPFFFDVNGFFKTRAAIAQAGTAAGAAQIKFASLSTSHLSLIHI